MRQLQKKEVKKMFKEHKRDIEIYLILENIQYARNVASIFRTADAARVNRIYLTGISQTPPFGKEMQQVSRHKEDSVEWMAHKDTSRLIEGLKSKGFKVVAIELTDEAINNLDLPTMLDGVDKVCFVAGSEVYGITKSTLAKCDSSVFIPMYGKGASLNVSTSVGVILFSF